MANTRKRWSSSGCARRLMLEKAWILSRRVKKTQQQPSAH